MISIETNPAKLLNVVNNPKQLKTYITERKNKRKQALLQYYKNQDKDLSTVNISDELCDILPTSEDLSKSHRNILNKPEMPIMEGYEQVHNMEVNGAKFGNIIMFDIPKNGKAIKEGMLILKLSKLQSKSNVRYIDYPGHKILKHVGINMGNHNWSYNSELYNIKRYTLKSDNVKKSWDKQMGQSTAQNFITNLKNKEFNLSTAYNYGYQTYKKTHDQLTLVIPIFLGTINGNTIPLHNKFDISIEIELAELQDLICFETSEGENKARNKKEHSDNLQSKVQCNIEKCEFYSLHSFMSGANWVLTACKWPTTFLKYYTIVSEHIKLSNSNHKLHTADGLINKIYIGFRPVKNNRDPKYWFSNSIIENQTQNTLIDQTPEFLLWNESNVPIKSSVINSLCLTVDNEEFSYDLEYSSTYEAYKNGYDTDFNLWYVFDVSRVNYKSNDNNKKIHISWGSTSISTNNPAELIIVIEKMCGLKVDGHSWFKKFGIKDEDFYLHG